MTVRHGWEIVDESGGGEFSDFVASAAGAAPSSVVARIGNCRIKVVPELPAADLTSEWKEVPGGADIVVATHDAEPHDVAMELLYCVGQAVWECVLEHERASWLKLLEAEIQAGVEGEIDEDVLAEKRLAAADPGDIGQLDAWASAAFASTLAEYVHGMWHDVTVRTGPEHLPSEWLNRRLQWFARVLPPDPGQQPSAPESA